MHSSFFNYSITRPYPYRWFTPVALMGAIVLIVLLSVMNFVQNSYSLVVEYTNDPNSTVSKGIWFENWPSYLTSGVRATCSPANLPVNTQFFTNQSGLMWTLTSVYKKEDTAAALPSLTYLNNRLENCVVRQIQMDFDGTKDRQVSVSQASAWDIQIRAFTTCGMWSPMGYTMLNLTAMYDAIQSYPVAGSSAFISRDPATRSSMYWAEALLSAYWVQTVNRIDEVSYNIKPSISKGVAVLYLNGTYTDITSVKFFEIAFNFLERTESSGWGWHGPLMPIEVYIKGDDINLDPIPQIWRQVDRLGKSMYSAVLADLGQSGISPKSNIVTNATTLQQFSADFSDIAGFTPLVFTQLETQNYTSRQHSINSTGPLGVTPSTISTKYLCQVPQRKSSGDILVSVLLADLVLLQAAWKLYTFIVDIVMFRKRPSLKHCDGCIDKQSHIQRLCANESFREGEDLKSEPSISIISLVNR